MARNEERGIEHPPIAKCRNLKRQDPGKVGRPPRGRRCNCLPIACRKSCFARCPVDDAIWRIFFFFFFENLNKFWTYICVRSCSVNLIYVDKIIKGLRNFIFHRTFDIFLDIRMRLILFFEKKYCVDRSIFIRFY